MLRESLTLLLCPSKLPEFTVALVAVSVLYVNFSLMRHVRGRFYSNRLKKIPILSDKSSCQKAFSEYRQIIITNWKS